MASADFAYAGLPGLPVGGLFTVAKSGSNWTYGGATITTRPTSRTDVVMLAVSTDGTAPSFAIAGDIVLTVPGS